MRLGNCQDGKGFDDGVSLYMVTNLASSLYYRLESRDRGKT